MAPESMTQKIREIIADVTHQPLGKIGDTASADSVDGWDSVAQINIICALEAELGIAVSASEMHSLTSVPKIRAAVAKQIESVA
jgi:acyl carrier protein